MLFRSKADFRIGVVDTKGSSLLTSSHFIIRLVYKKTFGGQAINRKGCKVGAKNAELLDSLEIISCKNAKRQRNAIIDTYCPNPHIPFHTPHLYAVWLFIFFFLSIFLFFQEVRAAFLRQSLPIGACVAPRLWRNRW